MSGSPQVTGFRPPDERWQKMRQVWDACDAASVEVPAAVAEFFGDEAPDPSGVTVELPLREYHDADEDGFELDVEAIPPQVTTIRFSVTW